MNTRHQLAALIIITMFMPFITWAEKIPSSASDVSPILIGETLPTITLQDANGHNVSLNEISKNEQTLLVFYRGGWCPYCNNHLADLRKIESELKQLGFQILAISPDLPKYLKQTEGKHDLKYQLLSDSKMEAAQALGLAFKVDDKTLTLYQEYDIDLEKASGQKHHMLPVPAAILLNPETKVTFVFAAPDYKTRIDNNILLAAAKAQVGTP